MAELTDDLEESMFEFAVYRELETEVLLDDTSDLAVSRELVTLALLDATAALAAALADVTED